jgi:hypothetical protein
LAEYDFSLPNNSLVYKALPKYIQNEISSENKLVANLSKIPLIDGTFLV